MHGDTDLLTEKQHLRLQALFGTYDHVEVGANWAIYRAMVALTANPTGPCAAGS